MKKEEKLVLCGASAYTEKFYFNPDFSGLPEGIKEELQIMCVLFTADVGGTISLVFDEEGTLQFEAGCDEMDLLYDDIGSVLKVKELQRNKETLLESLELYYRIFFLGEAYTPEEETL